MADGGQGHEQDCAAALSGGEAANVFIDAFENDEIPVTRGRRALDHIRSGNAVGAISELVVAKLLTKPPETGDKEMRDAYASLFSSSSIETRPIDRRVLMRAAASRAATQSFGTPDAIHIATAQIFGCAAFVAGDKRLSAALDATAIRLDASTVDNIRALA